MDPVSLFTFHFSRVIPTIGTSRRVQSVARISDGAGPIAGACPTIRPVKTGSIQREAGPMNDTATQANQAAMRTAIATGQRNDVAARFPEILCLDDFEEPARRYLPRPIFGYISGAVETNSSLAGNRSALDESSY